MRFALQLEAFSILSAEKVARCGGIVTQIEDVTFANFIDEECTDMEEAVEATIADLKKAGVKVSGVGPHTDDLEAFARINRSLAGAPR